jgi:hypothetical protein
VNYFVSTKPDITEGFPAVIGTGSAGGGYPAGWDVTFDSYGFLLRPDVNTPYLRSTERQNKQQIDTSEQAGEATLSSWWTRSQDTWDSGAGITWFDPKSDPNTLGRFHESQCIDVWTPGEFRLLKVMDVLPAVAGSEAWVANMTTSEGDGIVEFRGEVARRITGSGVDAEQPTGTSGTQFTKPAVIGAVALAGSTSGVWKFAPNDPALTLDITHASTHRSRVWWAKNRLIIAFGPTLYSAPLGATGALTSQTVLFTHPDADWLWTGLTETPTAILAAGYAEGTSGIYRLPLLTDVDDNPFIGPGALVGAMPNGEMITALGGYLGTVLVIGTTAGVRIGQTNSGGDVSLGPLTISTVAPVRDVVFRDRFAYIPLTRGLPDGSSGAARIDLSVRIGETERYAWATDARAPLGTQLDMPSIATIGDRVVLVNEDGTYLQSVDEYENVGYLDTGRIRYHTAEQKIFRYVRLVSHVGDGRVAITALDSTGNETNIISMDSSFSTTEDNIVQIPQKPLNQFLSFRIYLSSPNDDSPIISGLTVKAQPAATRVRLYQYPLQVADQERDRQGNMHRGHGYTRLAALEAAESTGAPMLVRDHRTGETFLGQIDSIDYSSTTAADKASGGFAGMAMVVVRKL